MDKELFKCKKISIIKFKILPKKVKKKEVNFRFFDGDSIKKIFGGTQKISSILPKKVKFLSFFGYNFLGVLQKNFVEISKFCWKTPT